MDQELCRGGRFSEHVVAAVKPSGETDAAAALQGLVLDSVVDGARKICDSDWCAIGLLARPSESLRVRHWAASPRALARSLSGEPGPSVPVRLLLEGGAYHRSEPGGPFPSSHSLIAATRSSLTLPIRVDSTVEGVVCIGRRVPGGFTDREETRLAWLAERSAMGIVHGRLLEEAYAESRRQRRTAEALALLTRATSRPFDVRSLGQQIVDTLLRLVGGARATLFAQDARDGRFRLVALARRSESTASGDVAAAEPGPVETLAARTGSLVATPDFLDEPGLSPGRARGGAQAVPIRAVLATPLLHGSRVMGILSLADLAGRRFEAEELNVFLVAADHAALALRTAYLHAQVTEAALVRERIRIAHELHDTLSQLAFSVGLKLDWCLHRAGRSSPLLPKLEDIRRHTGQMMVQIRQLIGHLADGGSEEATFPRRSECLIDDFRELTGMSVDFVLDGDATRLSPEAQDVVQKTLREALVNVAKHAHATRATVRIEVGSGEVVVAVADNGVGLSGGAADGENVPGHIGLRQMRDRFEALGGRLEILAGTGSGVCVRGVFPLR
jgi:signal transduction histidine kinase